MAKKKRGRSKIPPKRNKHHIVCRSRCTCNKHNNIVIICAVKHEQFHQLFGNMLPNEIVDYLVNYYWAGNWTWVEKALKERNNGNGHL